MNVLVLQPRRTLSYSFFRSDDRKPVCAGSIGDYRVSLRDRIVLVRALREMLSDCLQAASCAWPDAVAVRVPYGGTAFDRHAVVTSQVVKKLEEQTLHAPLHLPPVLSLIDCCREIFYSIPIVLMFETAFFADLPQREHLYALDSDLNRKWKLRRYGFHGLYHNAACASASEDFRTAPNKGLLKVLSICLDAKPELSSVVGRRPLTVTSGLTPLEGLPGETTSGELDSSIILLLAEQKGWNPDRVNSVLTRQSGLKGLVGRPVDLPEILTSDSEDVRLARDMFQYRLLLSSGAGVASMGGVDRVVFSGRYAELGEVLGPWLCSRLPMKRNNDNEDDKELWSCYSESLDRIIADSAPAVALMASAKAS